MSRVRIRGGRERKDDARKRKEESEERAKARMRRGERVKRVVLSPREKSLKRGLNEEKVQRGEARRAGKRRNRERHETRSNATGNQAQRASKMS